MKKAIKRFLDGKANAIGASLDRKWGLTPGRQNPHCGKNCLLTSIASPDMLAWMSRESEHESQSYRKTAKGEELNVIPPKAKELMMLQPLNPFKRIEFKVLLRTEVSNAR